MSQSGWNIPIIESLDGVCTLHNNRKSLNKNAFNSLLLLCWKKTGHDKLFIIIFLQKKQNKKKTTPWKQRKLTTQNSKRHNCKNFIVIHANFVKQVKYSVRPTIHNEPSLNTLKWKKYIYHNFLG